MELTDVLHTLGKCLIHTAQLRTYYLDARITNVSANKVWDLDAFLNTIMLTLRSEQNSDRIYWMTLITCICAHTNIHVLRRLHPLHGEHAEPIREYADKIIKHIEELRLAFPYYRDNRRIPVPDSFIQNIKMIVPKTLH